MTSTFQPFSHKRWQLILGLLIVSLFGGTAAWWYTSYKSEPLYNFVYEKDAQDVFEIFDKNWFWLMPTPKEEWSPTYIPYVFKHRAPQANPLSHGKLNVKVLRDNGNFAGFVGYYMKPHNIGFLLYLGVKEVFRGKRYGEKLAKYAINDMTTIGAKKINLVTRVINRPARNIYERIGFKEIMRDKEGYIYYEYNALQ